MKALLLVSVLALASVSALADHHKKVEETKTTTTESTPADSKMKTEDHADHAKTEVTKHEKKAKHSTKSN